MDPIQHAHHPDGELFRLARQGYLIEAEHLANVAASPYFERLLEVFANYSEFLTSNRENCCEPFLFGTWLERKVVSFDDPSESVRGLSACINLAAACAVFGGWTLPIDSLERSRLRATVDESINAAREQHQNAAAVLAAKLNSGDASRLIHMLKLLGWIDPDLTASAQLSLGASGGTKDRHAIATFPVRRCSLSRHDSIAKGYGYT